MVVGEGLVDQHTPRLETAPPPAEETFPPVVAEEMVIEEAAVVDTVARLAFKVVN